MIYFERQEGSLCAQHALNNLLQDNIFNAVDLSEIARALDQTELQAWSESKEGVDSDEYKKFTSSNYDDTGFFSVQVLINALKVWSLDLVQVSAISSDIIHEKAIICNVSEHWFSLRSFGSNSDYWFNLNSMLDSPTHVSSSYLLLFLTQLLNEGGRIFAVRGDFPQCKADLDAMTGLPPSEFIRGSQDMVVERGSSDEDDDLKKALALSMGDVPVNMPNEGSSNATLTANDDQDADLYRAIEASLSSEKSSERKELSAEELRAARLKAFAPKDYKGKGKAE